MILHQVMSSKNSVSQELKLLEDVKDEIKFIKSGRDHIAIVTRSNDLFVYGSNYCGQLGIKDKKKLNKFMKNNVNLGKIKCIECYNDCTVIVNNFNEIYGTGFLLFIHPSFRYALTNNETVYNFTKIINFQSKIKFIKCLFATLVIVAENNEIYLQGENNLLTKKKFYRELTNVTNLFINNDTNLSIKDLKLATQSLFILDIFGSIYCFGQGLNGQLGLGSDSLKVVDSLVKIELPFKVKKIKCDNEVTFLINEDNELFGTGDNFNDKLGLNGYTEKYFFTKINLLKVKDIYLFPNFTILFTKENEIYCCGANTEENILGIDKKDCKVSFNYFGGELIQVVTFQKNKNIKINLSNVWIFENENELLYFEINNKVNEEYEERNLLGENCFNNLQLDRLVDLFFITK